MEDIGVIPQQSLITVNEDPMGEGKGNSCNDISRIFFNYREASPEDRQTTLQ
jgi:hypothetical protein